MKHETTIKGYEDIKLLAEDISQLRYDALREFLGQLGLCLYSDGLKDFQIDKPELSSKLVEASEKISRSAIDIKDAWKICEPYMKDKE